MARDGWRNLTDSFVVEAYDVLATIMDLLESRGMRPQTPWVLDLLRSDYRREWQAQVYVYGKANHTGRFAAWDSEVARERRATEALDFRRQ